MAVIGGQNPTATVTVPVPTPAPMKKPKQPQQQAVPQPVPANPGSQQQDVPQGMSPVPMVPQLPEPRAIILPWAPPPSGTPRSVMRKMRVRYALNEGYRGEHTAPDSTSGAPLHDVTANGIYPEDVYSRQGLRYYGTGDDAGDAEMHAKINRLRGKPKKMILIYRAIPHGLKGAKINRGDWVTLSKKYAMDHGRSALNGKYRILTKIANAQDVFTNGDSWHEWGYDPVQGREESKPEHLQRRYARTTPESVQKLEQAVKDDPDNEDLRHAWADEIEESGDKDRADVIRNGPRSIQVNARRWFSRPYGNTYHTAQIIVDGKEVPGVSKTYGYGSHYLWSAADQLEKLGIMKGRKRLGSGGGTEGLSWWTMRHGIKFDDNVEDVRRQRDLHQMSRPKKYAMNDDDMDGMLDFSMDAMHPEGTEPPRRPPPKEDITGRNRKRILQQMLEAAKKGHYDPAGMTPRDYIAEMEAPKDIEPGQGQVWMSDPEDELPPDQPTKMNRRIEYPRKYTASDPLQPVSPEPDDDEPEEPETHECENCGDTHEDESNLVEMRRGANGCVNCTSTCEHCDNPAFTDDMVEVQARDRRGNMRDRMVCESCRDDHYTQCDDCSNVVPDDQTTRINRRDVCQGCQEDNYFHCDECNDTYHNDDYGENGMCESCADDAREQSAKGKIHDYGYDPPQWNRHGDEDERHYGVELETVTNKGGNLKDNADFVLETLNDDASDEDFAYLKEDSSLSGGVGSFEIVTHPATLDVHKERWPTVFSNHPKSLVSHDNPSCGLHIHVEREGLTDLTVGKIVTFVNSASNKDFIEKLARRNSAKYAELDPDKKPWSRGKGRYEAVNLQNDKTIEFRIFKGTLNAQSFFQSLEFADAITEFSKPATYSINEMPNAVATGSFFNFVEANRTRYPNLHAFCLKYSGKEQNVEGPYTRDGQPPMRNSRLSALQMNTPVRMSVTLTMEDQPTKMNRQIEYPRRMARSTPESVEKLFDAVSRDPDNHDLRAALADELSEQNHPKSVIDNLRSGHRVWIGKSPTGTINAIPFASLEHLKQPGHWPGYPKYAELFHLTMRGYARPGKIAPALRVRPSGKLQTWKTRPGEFRLPVKHGMYQNGEITHDNFHEWLINDPTSEPT